MVRRPGVLRDELHAGSRSKAGADFQMSHRQQPDKKKQDRHEDEGKPLRAVQHTEEAGLVWVGHARGDAYSQKVLGATPRCRSAPAHRTWGRSQPSKLAMGTRS